MMMKIFSVRDSAVEAFLQPFFSPTRGAAIRSVSDAVNDPKHEFSKHAQYFALYELGSFDDSSGVVSPPDNGLPEPVISCIELINKA